MLRALEDDMGTVQAELRRLLRTTSGTTLTSARATALITPIVEAVRVVGANATANLVTGLGWVGNTVAREFATGHRTLFVRAGLDPEAVALRFEIIPSQIVAPRVYGLGRLPVSTYIERQTEFTVAQVERWMRGVVGSKATDRRAVEAVMRLLEGRSPVSIGGVDTRILGRGIGLQAGLTRIISTETYDTMREGTALASVRSPVIYLAKWTLSLKHRIVDICDQYATTDVGYGPGWYPGDQYPAHPHPMCACYQGDVQVRPVSDWG